MRGSGLPAKVRIGSAQSHGLLLVIETSCRYTAGRLICMGWYVFSLGGGSHVAHVANAQPVTKQRARNRRRFIVVAYRFMAISIAR